MYVDIDQQGEVSLAKMTIEEATFLERFLTTSGSTHCCNRCGRQIYAIATIIRSALREHELRKASGVECSMQESTTP